MQKASKKVVATNLIHRISFPEPVRRKVEKRHDLEEHILEWSGAGFTAVNLLDPDQTNDRDPRTDPNLKLDPRRFAGIIQISGSSTFSKSPEGQLVAHLVLGFCRAKGLNEHIKVETYRPNGRKEGNGTAKIKIQPLNFASAF